MRPVLCRCATTAAQVLPQVGERRLKDDRGSGDGQGSGKDFRRIKFFCKRNKFCFTWAEEVPSFNKLIIMSEKVSF